MLRNLHTVIICTRNRPSEVLRIVKNIGSCRGVNELDLIVVDNNDFPDLENSEILSHRASFRNLRIVSSDPGLPLARNTGLELTERGIVTFFDDDACIPENYFVSMDNLFSIHPDIGGCSPAVQGDPIEGFVKKFINRLFAGRITIFGFTYWYTETKRGKVPDVEWLPGCAMTFRTDDVGKIRFNTNLQNGPLGGYALGEDVDFSMRLGFNSRLTANLELEIQHVRDQTDRPNTFEFEEGIGRWLGYLVRKSPKVKFIFVFATLLLKCAISFFVFWKKDANSLRLSIVRLSAFLAEYRYPSM